MTYESDIDGRRHATGYYVAFDGIETRLSTHDFSASPWSLAGTYLPALRDVPSGGPQKLDRRRGLVLPDGFSVTALGTRAVHQMLRRRGGIEAPLVTSIAVDGESLQVPSAAFADGATVYVDRETVVLQDEDDGHYTLTTRGALGSQAAPHKPGAIVSTVPRYWKGRRAVLYAVNLETGSSKAIRAGRLSRSPRFKNGTYELTFTDLQRELARPINGGWLPQRATAVPEAAAGSGVVLYVEDARAYVDDNATGLGYLKTSSGDVFEVWHLIDGSVDTDNNTITLLREQHIYSSNGGGPGASLFNGASSDVEVQQVLYLVGDPATLALMLMLSIEGDFTNGPYDILPGRIAVEGLPPRRQGAGIPQDWVDVESWEAAADGPPMVLYSDEQEVLLDVLVAEALWHLGGKLVVNGDGKLAFSPNRAAVPESTLPVIDGSNRLINDVEGDDDESEILSLAEIECNWDPAAREYLRKTTVHFEDTTPIYGEDLASISIRSRTTWVGAASPSPLVSPPYGDETALTVAFDRYGARTRNGLRRTSLRLPWDRHLDAIPGWVFKLTHDELPDGEGGVGFVERQMECVSADPDYKAGTVVIEAEEMRPGWLVAPSFVVGGYGAGTPFTPDIFLPELAGDAADLFDDAPVLDFPDGCTVRIYDASASPPFSVSGTMTADVADFDGTLAITGDASGLGFTPAAGDLVVLENSANTGNVNAANADVQDHLFLADDAGIIDDGGATERPENKWA